jgi:hypothetical protein
MPKSTPEEVEAREKAMQIGLITAVSVPASLANRANSMWDTLKDLAHLGNVGCKSDLQVRKELGLKYPTEESLSLKEHILFTLAGGRALFGHSRIWSRV